MFGWLFGKKENNVEEKTEKAFSAVREDMSALGKWIKHLNNEDKQLFMAISEIKEDLSSIKAELGELRGRVEMEEENEKGKQVFKKLPVLGKQTAVQGVQIAVQTPVQTGNFYDIFRSLTSNERLLVFTLMNSDMKMSYEDLAMLLGKERATIRGQINAIKQKSEGLIEEIIEKNGKKRVFIPAEIREKLAKYAKVRVGKSKKSEKTEENSEIVRGEEK